MIVPSNKCLNHIYSNIFKYGKSWKIPKLKVWCQISTGLNYQILKSENQITGDKQIQYSNTDVLGDYK